MRILISAVACSPLGGSEGGVGWSAVKRLSARHEVAVLTHRQFEQDWIDSKSQVPGNVHVRFLGQAKPWHPNRMIARMQSWDLFTELNREVLGAALEWHRQTPFDVIQQVTYATWRVPSPLWQMPIPFIWGPIGGAATIPRAFLGMLSPQARALEWARSLQSAWAKRSRAFDRCLRNAAVVLAANEETEAFLRPGRNGAPLLRLPVASLPLEKVERFMRPSSGDPVEGGVLRMFAGGNIEGRKGVSLALRALAKVKAAGVAFHYTVAGGGPEIPKLQQLAKALGIEEVVTFHPGFAGDDYVRVLQSSDIYLLPSFRETTPVTLQEAILAGCYAVVADASAAGEMVRMAGGSAVAAGTPEAMVDGLAAELIRVAGDRPAIRAQAAEASRKIGDYYSGVRYDEVTEEAFRIATEGRRPAGHTKLLVET